jgi:hypothetical protein
MISRKGSVLVCLTAVVMAGVSFVSFAQAPPATVITHGYQFGGTVPDWTYALADAIARRVGIEGGEDGVVLIYEGSSGALVPCQEVWCTTNGSAHTVIVFDWADDSNETGTGFSEAAAEALFAGLVSWSQGENASVDLDRLHLIGHSRGAIVNSEVAERLMAAGLPAPEQITTLDPHDAGAGFVASGQVPEGGLDDYDVNQEHPEYNCHAESSIPGVCSWLGGGYNDNYWQDDTGCFFLLPDGLELYGLSNFNQNELDNPFCHSETHRWYLLTADTTAPVHPVTGLPPGPDWYGSGSQCTTSPRTTPLDRTADGYNLSAAAGGVANRCPTGPGSRQQILFDFSLQEGFVGGDFERGSSSLRAGWWGHGGVFQAISETDAGNQYLVLSGGDLARHNRTYLPETTGAVQLCRQVQIPSPGDALSLTLSGPSVPEREMLSTAQQDLSVATGWDCFSVPIEAAEQGEVVQLTFSVSNVGSPRVLVDDVRLIPREASYCFSFDNLCDGIEISSVLPDKTVVATWRNWDCAGASAPMLGGYSGKNVTPKLSWLAADRDADFATRGFNLNVDTRTFDLWVHDTDFSLIQIEDDQPYSVTPGACSFGPEKLGMPASTGVGR